MVSIRSDNTSEIVYFKILNFISFRPRSEEEIFSRLEQYLSKAKLSNAEKEDVQNNLINKLKQDGYINDESFALSYIQSISNSQKSTSKRKIFQFLLKRGVHKAVISKAIEALPSDFSLKSALKEAEKKLKLMGKIDDFSRKRKLYAFLFRKGYDSETISSVIDTLF